MACSGPVGFSSLFGQSIEQQPILIINVEAESIAQLAVSVMFVNIALNEKPGLQIELSYHIWQQCEVSKTKLIVVGCDVI